MSNVFSNIFQGAVGGIADTSLRDKLIVEMNFLSGKVERLEKENAELNIKLDRYSKKCVELEAKIPPENLIDAGRCFLKKLADGSIDDIPYCYVCKSPMNALFRASGLTHFSCSRPESACGFELSGKGVLDVFKKHGVAHEFY